MNTERPLVYLAGPYTQGDVAINVHGHAMLFHRLMDEGVVWPFMPVTSHMLHLIVPRAYEDWIALDMAYLQRCDALLRIDVLLPVHARERDHRIIYHQYESAGAENEIREAQYIGRPVFYNRESLYVWAKGWKP